MLKDAKKDVLGKSIEDVIKKLTNMSESLAHVPMLSRTHGQPASPTTVGKEMGNFAYRVHNQYSELNALNFCGKLNGAVGNFNSHLFTYPEYEWA